MNCLFIFRAKLPLNLTNFHLIHHILFTRNIFEKCFIILLLFTVLIVFTMTRMWTWSWNMTIIIQSMSRWVTDFWRRMWRTCATCANIQLSLFSFRKYFGNCFVFGLWAYALNNTTFQSSRSFLLPVYFLMLNIWLWQNQIDAENCTYFVKPPKTCRMNKFEVNMRVVCNIFHCLLIYM